MTRIQIFAVRAAFRSAVLGLTLGCAFASSANASTTTVASLDWSSLTFATTEPSLVFVDDASYGTTVTAYTQGFVASLSAPISAGDPGTGVAASANASTLHASVVSAAGQGYAARSADVTRGADFQLGDGASVTFTISATVSTNAAADPLTTSFASLAVVGGDLGYQVSSLGLSANGSSRSETGLLSLTVTNTSGATVTSYLVAEGTANVEAIAAVPEPATVLLMLPGMLVGGFAVSRRRASQR